MTDQPNETTTDSTIPPAPCPLFMERDEFTGRWIRYPKSDRATALRDYRDAAHNLTEHLENFPIYDQDGLLSEWIAVNSGRIARVNGLLTGFNEQIQLVIAENPRVAATSQESVVGTEARHITREDIVSAIGDALQSVTVQTESKPTNYTISNYFHEKDSTAEDRAETAEAAPETPHKAESVEAGGPAGVAVTPEVIEAVAEFLFDTGVDMTMINALRSVAKCLRNDLADPVEYTRNAASRMQQSPGRFSQPRPPGYAR